MPETKQTEIRTDYRLTAEQIRQLGETDPFYVTLLANAAAVLMDAMPEINWAGFYIMREGKLAVGPFQGKPACIHIPVGSGVCGTCVQTDAVQRVENVHEFPGHIACDSTSNSEIVLPIHAEGKVAAVLDIDSRQFGRFTETDQAGLEMLVRVLEEKLRWK